MEDLIDIAPDAEVREEQELSRLDGLIARHGDPIGDLAFMRARVEREGILLKGQRNYLAKSRGVGLVIAEKSRRVGLTWAQASDDVMTAATQPPYGYDVNYVGTSKEMAREYIDACADFARSINAVGMGVDEYIFTDKALPGSAAEDNHIQVFRISFGSGNKIEALSARPRSFRGRSGRAVLDEFAFQDKPAELVKAAGAFLIRNGDVRIISTHNGVSSIYNQYINEVRAGQRDGIVVRYDFEDAVADGLYESLQYGRNEEPTREGKIKWLQTIFGIYKDNVEEELFCVPSSSGGSFMSRMLIESACRKDIPVLRWRQPPEFTFLSPEERFKDCEYWCLKYLKPQLDKLNPREEHCFGSDFARSSDLSVMWPISIRKSLERATPFTIELGNIPYDQQKQILFFMVDNLPRFRKGAMDATGNGEYLAEAARQRYGEERVVAVRFSTAWYRENMPGFKAAFEDGMFFIPMDDEVVADIYMFEMVNGVARMPTVRRSEGSGQKRHGDAGIAAVLAEWASTLDFTPIEFGEVDHKRVGFEDGLEKVDVGFGAVVRSGDFGGYL